MKFYKKIIILAAASLAFLCLVEYSKTSVKSSKIKEKDLFSRSNIEFMPVYEELSDKYHAAVSYTPNSAVPIVAKQNTLVDPTGLSQTEVGQTLISSVKDVYKKSRKMYEESTWGRSERIKYSQNLAIKLKFNLKDTQEKVKEILDFIKYMKSKNPDSNPSGKNNNVKSVSDELKNFLYNLEYERM